jgi:hypothetical protein
MLRTVWRSASINAGCAVMVLLLAFLAGGCELPAVGAGPEPAPHSSTTPWSASPTARRSASPTARRSASPTARRSASPTARTTKPVQPTKPAGVALAYPRHGSGRWRVASAEKSPAGGSGNLRRYRVSVERDITGVDVGEFADAVTRTLNDPRGWTAGGQIRLRRVGRGQPHDFTV